MTKMNKVMLVDDDPKILDVLTEYLVKHELQVFIAQNADSARDILSKECIDIAVIDLCMPGEDGVSLTRYLYQQYHLGIIILSGVTDRIEKVLCLEIGADDFLSKPCDPRELLARIRSLLRRLANTKEQIAVDDSSLIAIGRCFLDIKQRKLFDQNKTEISLTRMEFDLLETFVKLPNQVLSRDQLLSLSHHKALEPFDRSIDVRINRIRKKIELIPHSPRYIKTIHGKGYLFCPQGNNLRNIEGQ